MIESFSQKPIFMFSLSFFVFFFFVREIFFVFISKKFCENDSFWNFCQLIFALRRPLKMLYRFSGWLRCSFFFSFFFAFAPICWVAKAIPFIR